MSGYNLIPGYVSWTPGYIRTVVHLIPGYVRLQSRSWLNRVTTQFPVMPGYFLIPGYTR